MEVEDKILPLTYDQRDIWLAAQINTKSSSAYKELIYLQFEGPLNVEFLNKSLQQVIQSHSSLRTIFHENGLYQTIKDPQESKLKIYDISLENENIREQLLKNWSKSFLEMELRPESDSIFIPSLIKISANNYILALAVHHIVADGYSVSLILKDLSIFYNINAKLLPPIYNIPMQFWEFAEKEADLTKKIKEEAISYWKNELKGPLPILEMPTDYMRPHVKSYAGEHYNFKIEKKLKNKLQEVGKNNNITLFTTLLAAFKILLSRYTGQNELIIGVPCSKRDSEEDKTCVGHCTALLPIRTIQHDQISVIEFLKLVRSQLYNAIDNKFINFNSLFHELGLIWDMSRSTPLIDVIFNMDSITDPLEFDNLKSNIISINTPSSDLKGLEIENETSKFDLFMNITGNANYLDVVIEFSTDLFSRNFIHSFANNFVSTLESLIINYTKPLGEIQILSHELTDLILYKWNDTYKNFPKDSLVTTLFEEQVLLNKNNIALISDNCKITYKDLNQKANVFADFLLKKGVNLGEKVIVGLDRSYDYIVAIIAILKVGGIYIPINHNLPSERIELIIKDSQSKILISKSTLINSQLSVEHIVLYDTLSLKEDISNNFNKQQSSLDPVYIIYTSGSTGVPKGVSVSHRAVNRTIRNTNYINITSQDRISLVCDLSFDVSMFEIWGALLNGAALVIFTKDEIIDYYKLSSKLAKYRVNIGTLTPALFHNIVQNDIQILSRYKTLIVAGDILDPQLTKLFVEIFPNISLINCYGPTEATIFSTYYKVPNNFNYHRVPIGKPISNTTIYILDHLLRVTPIGSIGELYIGGPGIANEYLNKPELTAEKFIANPFNNQVSDVLFKTGDLARYLPDGNIDFIGRKDSQVKIAGYRVELGEIENVLRHHPLIQDVAVLTSKADFGDKKLEAYASLSCTKDFVSHINISSSEKDNSFQAQNYLDEWQGVWNQTYKEKPSEDKEEFNIVGWINSYDSKPFSDSIMLEWTETTVERILKLQPKKILEIGCGTGLLLLRIAPFCKHYLGIDSSTKAIELLNKIVEQRKVKNVVLLEAFADQIDNVEQNDYDVIIINSVIQYFPNSEYLTKVLDKAMTKVVPNGAIFIGDIRSLCYQYPFKTAVELYKSADNLPLKELYNTVNEKLLLEEELLVDPEFFVSYSNNTSVPSGCQFILKKSIYRTEMSQYRYDVTLFKNRNYTNLQTQDYIILDWKKENLSMGQVEELLDNEPQGLIINNIPNALVIDQVLLTKMLENMVKELSVEEFKKLFSQQLEKQESINPYDLWKLESIKPYHVNIFWEEYENSTIRAIFIHKDIYYNGMAFYHKFSSSLTHCTNNPLLSKYLNEVIKNIKDYSHKKLPEYMVPSEIKLLYKMPLTNSRKVNRTLLPNFKKVQNIPKVLPRSNEEQLLYDSLKELITESNISVEENLIDLGLTSLSVIRWVMILRKYGINIRPQVVFMNPTIEKLAEIVSNSMHENSLEQQELSVITPTEDISSTNLNMLKLSQNLLNKNNVLITGTTGFLGIHLLQNLLINPNIYIYCLIRDSNIENAKMRLLKNYHWHFPDSNISKILNRIIIINGDISKFRLGLDQSDWENLCATIDGVYHCAANVRHLGITETYTYNNYLGTENIIEFCKHRKPKILNFMSTVAVMGLIKKSSNNTEDIFTEENLNIQQYFIDPYSESKYKAELKVQEFIAAGGEANVFRIGTIGASSLTGIFQKNIHENYFTRLINSIINLKMAPYLPNYNQDYLPVDIVSNSIISLSLLRTNRTYHIYNSNTFSLYEMCLMLQAIGYQVNLVDYNDYQKKVVDVAEKYKLLDHIGGIGEILDHHNITTPKLDCKYTQDILLKLGIEFPKPNIIQITNLIKCGIELGYFKEPNYWGMFKPVNTQQMG
jgi:amino acid adenylation domain-containing protein/thioester reductase-like protein